MSRIQSLARPHLTSLQPYSSARDEYTGMGKVFLDANENAMGSVAGGKWNRYPDPHQTQLKTAISGIKAIEVGKIFVGNGSDEPIDLLIRAFCEPGEDSILICPPTYGMYRVSAQIHNCGVVEAPLDSAFGLDLEGIQAAFGQNPKLTFLCSPNNPTGNALDTHQILEVVRSAPGLVIVDEAYVDFCPKHTLQRYVEHFENLVVLQTFSKAWGMAGFRLGMAFSNEEIVDLLDKIKPPYNISGPIQEQALSSLLQFEKKDAWVREITEARSDLLIALQSIPSVRKIHPSDANFLLVQFDRSADIFRYLRDQQIVVRDRSRELNCEGCLRITVGTKAENEQLLNALQAFH